MSIGRLRRFRLSLLSAVLILTLVAFAFGEETTRKPPLAVQGTLDLRGYDPSGLYRLGGKWAFWKDELVKPEEAARRFEQGTMETQTVPSYWSKLGLFDSDDSLSHAGTLALEVILPRAGGVWAIRLPNASTACSLFVDGKLLDRIGIVSLDRKTFVPNNGIRVVPFAASGERVFIVLQVANFATPYTGTWESPLIGPAAQVNAKRHGDVVTASLIGGAIFFMGLYHLGLYLLRRKDKTTLYFGIICIFMTVRNMIMGERVLLDLFPFTWRGWQTAFTVEHLSAHLTLPLFMIFFRSLYPRHINTWAVRISLGAGILWAILEIGTPALFHHRFLPWYEYTILVFALYLLISISAAAVQKEDGAAIILAGVAFMVVTVVNDVLLSNGVIQSVYMSSFGLFIFTFSQSFFLSARFSKLFMMVERYSRELEHLNHSLERFIPHEVLGFLSKKSIVDVELGDFSEEFMSVFFLDIRDFTARSENMTPGENFRFINAFLERFGPLIREHGGFIDKYLGDGFMALFPGKPDRALEAALAMREMLREFNAGLPAGTEPLRYGIGINSGNLMLGTIGENERMDSTVISDTVNTASRLEQLTKIHGTDVLVSDTTVRALDRPDRFPLEKIGDERIKGKSRSVGVFKLV